MSKTYKKDIVTDPIHRKAGPHKKKQMVEKVCPRCRGACIDPHTTEDMFECGTCYGQGSIFIEVNE